jgi:hypothetical protein
MTIFSGSLSRNSVLDFTPPSDQTKQVQERRRSTIVLLCLAILFFVGLVVAVQLAKLMNAEFAQDTLALVSQALW